MVENCSLSWGIFLLAKGFLGLNHGLDTAVHVLDEGSLSLSESLSVGDVKGSVSGFGVFSVDTTNLDVVFLGDSLKSLLVLGQVWQADVDGSSHGSAEVGWARSDETEMVVMGELGNTFELVDSAAKSVKDALNVCTWLHGDDSELILLIDPHEEGLVVVVEDTSAVGPVTVQVASIQETISLLEEEMVGDELFLVSLAHGVEWVELTSEIAFETFAALGDSVHNFVTLFIGDTWSECVGSKVTANTDSGALDHLGFILWERWAVHAVAVHFRDVHLFG